MTPDLDKLEEAASAIPRIERWLKYGISIPSDSDSKRALERDLAGIIASHRALEEREAKAKDVATRLLAGEQGWIDHDAKVFERLHAAEAARDLAEFLLAVMAEFAASNWSDVQELQGHVFLNEGELKSAEASLAVARAALEKVSRLIPGPGHEGVGDIARQALEEIAHGAPTDPAS